MKKNNFLWLGISLLTFLFSCNEELKQSISTESDRFKSASSAIEFSVLSYNVAGLPGIMSSAENRDTYTPIIGELINDYNIVNVQEDFNYHAALYETDLHAYCTPTSGGVPLGDGLNTMSDYSYTDFVRVGWDDCNGTDCLTPKGFTMLRVRMQEGVYVDVYNVHTNAGSNDPDYVARRANITQLVNYINANSSGNAVLLFGDTNCRYTRSPDNIRLIISSLGMTDAWVDLIKHGNAPIQGSGALVCSGMETVLNDYSCEIVDKVFYRGNAFVNLEALSCTYEDAKFRAQDGSPLSDHRPLLVNFVCELNDAIKMSDQFGGPHGIAFTDVNHLGNSPVVSSVGIRSGSRIDQVNMELSNGTSFTHGGNGGTSERLILNSGEYVKSITLCSGKKDGHTRIFYVRYKTSSGRTLTGGSTTSETVTYVAPTGWQIVGFHGRSDEEIDKLGVIYAPVK